MIKVGDALPAVTLSEYIEVEGNGCSIGPNHLILFVTHDIDSIKNICDEIIILKNGKIIEKGLTQEILNSPKESYTKKLIDSTFKNKDFRK